MIKKSLTSRHRYNSLIVAGGNGSGKSMLLNAIDNCLMKFTKDPEKQELSTCELKLKFHEDGREYFVKDFKNYFNVGNTVYKYFPAIGRINCIDKDNNITAVNSFLSKLKADANDRSSDSCEKSKQIITVFESSLSDLMETNVTIELSNKTLHLRENNRTHPFDHLPHGYTAVISIFGCIFKEVIERGGTQDTVRGLVIIDEPELHLHVSLQKSFMSTHIRMFPKIQYIIATHSPFLINSTINTVIYDLEKRKVIYHPDELRNDKLSGWVPEE